MPQFPYTPELKAFQDADDAWHAELTRIFGKDAGQARYEPRARGSLNSKLSVLHEAREYARRAWYASKDKKETQ